MNKFVIQEISFQGILPYWSILWPEKKSPIQLMSSMKYKGGYDIKIYNKYSPVFIAMYNESNKIIGVNSGHRTSRQLYRSRGLWIDDNYRGRRLSVHLLKEIENHAVKENCRYIWSIPRKEALRAYESNGYIQTSDFFNNKMEFGPNCYVIKEL